MRDVLLIGFGGFLGAVLRYGISGMAHSMLRSFEYPIGTLVVNLLGSFILVFLASASEFSGIFAPGLRAFIFIGLLGAFTTFSTFSLETVMLLVDGQIGPAIGNAGANLGLCLLAAVAARSWAVWVWR